MTGSRLLQHLLQLLLPLWLTASLVFVLSRVLPAANRPKGMTGAEETTTHGLSDAAAIRKIHEDYRKRAGYALPLFYADFTLTGKEQAKAISIAPPDQDWVTQAVLWHGLAPARSFYAFWRAREVAVPEKERGELRRLLRIWVASESASSRLSAQQALARYMASFSKDKGNTLLKEWEKLASARAPAWYYLPQLRWHGTKNSYHQWLTKLWQGDLGISTQDYQSVTAKIGEAVTISFSVALFGLVLALLAAYLLGTFFAMHPMAAVTKVSHFFLYLLDSIPAFLIALALFALSLSWLDLSAIGLSGEETEGNSILSLWRQPSVLLAGLCLSLLILPHLTLQFYRSLRDQTGKLYLRTALAKGLSTRKVLRRHALPNAMVASVTLVSEVIIGLMAGVLVIEITFSLPGIGSLLTHSILTGDYPVMIGLTFFFLLFRSIVIWVTEIGLRLLDPRMSST